MTSFSKKGESVVKSFDKSQYQDLLSCEIQNGWLITPRSYLLDRFTPACEQVFLPKTNVRGGKLFFYKGSILAKLQQTSRIRRLKQMIMPERRREEDGVLIDMRNHAPGNWAHFLTNHLPLMFNLIDELKLSSSQVKIILPRKTPTHIREAAEIFGLCFVCTDDIVEGVGVSYDMSPWHGMHSMRHEWVNKSWVKMQLASAIQRNSTMQDLPKRVFISRRDSRRLHNENEVAAHLSRLGFKKLYIEDFPVVDQFRLFNEAEQIVAIHGAGIAPLLYRKDRNRPLTLIELFPVGHTIFVWRALAHQVGSDWIGVRGHLRKRHIDGIYDFSKPFLKFSLEDFTIDVASIDLALEVLNRSPNPEKLDHD